MIEVELKVSIKNLESTICTLKDLEFCQGDLYRECDWYFDDANHSIRSNDKALRIRSSENVTLQTKECFMTFKGPKMDEISMTRKELEMKIESTQAGVEFLKALGYVPVEPVKKLRQYFQQGEVTVCVDRVENLGEFLELEVLVATEQEKANALEKLILLLGQLGYEREEIVRTSYLSMLQKRNYLIKKDFHES